LKVMFTVDRISEIYLVSNDRKLSLLGYKGRVIFDISHPYAPNFIESILNEALQKYKRMHYESRAVRLDKSWIGLIGETVCKVVLSKQMSIEVCNKEKKIIDGYDGGDIVIKVNNKERIVNVSTRKLSEKDEILNVIINPDEYFALIPVEQFKQYTEKSHIVFFIFVKTNLKQSILIQNETFNVITHADFILPGYLTSRDISYMRKAGYIAIKKKGEKIKGLYNSLSYNVKMYTDNYVIFVNLLRRFNFPAVKQPAICLFDTD
jgi:hypothetical protein